MKFVNTSYKTFVKLDIYKQKFEILEKKVPWHFLCRQNGLLFWGFGPTLRLNWRYRRSKG